MRVKYNPADDLVDHYFPPEKEEIELKTEIELEEIVEKGEGSNKKRWQPKKWKPEYEQVVMMDLMGLKGYEIAEKMGITPQHVYNILGTDEAIAIQRAMVGRIRKDTFNMTETLQEIQELTVKRLKQCLKSDEDFKTSKLGFIGKGLEVMKGLGEHLKPAPQQQINNFNIPPSVADRFLAGLEKSDEARKLLAEKASTE